MKYLRSGIDTLYFTSANFFIGNTLDESHVALFVVRSTSNTLQQAPHGVPARLYVSERVVGGAPATFNARPARRANKGNSALKRIAPVQHTPLSTLLRGTFFSFFLIRHSSPTSDHRPTAQLGTDLLLTAE